MAFSLLLINPNQLKPAVAPLALDYLSNALHGRGIATHILDLCFSCDVPGDLASFLNDRTVDLIGITIRNIDDSSINTGGFFLPGVRDLVLAIRKLTKAPIVLGGCSFSIMPEEVLAFCGGDFGIAGDGEEPLTRLVHTLQSKEDYRSIPGLLFRNGNEIVRTPSSYFGLDGFVSRSHPVIDNERYFKEGGMAGVETKRGCQGACTYCADPLSKGRTVRQRSPHSVVDELQVLLDMGIDHVHFCDSEFNMPADHAEAVCEEIISRGLGDRLKWYAYVAPAPFSKRTAFLFRKSGCRGLNFGADSGADSMLRALGRGFGVAEVVQTAAICRQEGLVFMYDLLLGGPGEDRETMTATIDLMKAIGPDRIGIALGARMFPGTALGTSVRSMGPLDKNPNLVGAVAGNDSLLAPVFYRSAAMGPEPARVLAELIGGDGRFLFMDPDASAAANYNYNENNLLVEAIESGYRGAFWDILRRLAEA